MKTKPQIQADIDSAMNRIESTRQSQQWDAMHDAVHDLLYSLNQRIAFERDYAAEVAAEKELP